MRCIPLISKVKNGDIIPTGQYLNYQSFTNLKLLKNFFHTKKIEVRDTTGEKTPFVFIGNTRVVLLFRKIADNLF